ncbi:MAG: hypothetical protein JSV52_11125 [Candidatus Zixiibacteriota bacterium]|nr:MAG: hypothetical protein JSV52_11125 [candidate division Zixibacteria bacterium]
MAEIWYYLKLYGISLCGYTFWIVSRYLIGIRSDRIAYLFDKEVPGDRKLRRFVLESLAVFLILVIAIQVFGKIDI